MAHGGLIALVEEPGADQLAVAGGDVEAVPRFAVAPPRGGGRGEGVIGEASAGGVDAGVEHADYDVGCEGREGPEAGGGGETEEDRGAGGMGVAEAVWEDSEDGREASDGCGLGGGEAGGETGRGPRIGVEESGGLPAG